MRVIFGERTRWHTVLAIYTNRTPHFNCILTGRRPNYKNIARHHHVMWCGPPGQAAPVSFHGLKKRGGPSATARAARRRGIAGGAPYPPAGRASRRLVGPAPRTPGRPTGPSQRGRSRVGPDGSWERWLIICLYLEQESHYIHSSPFQS